MKIELTKSKITILVIIFLFTVVTLFMLGSNYENIIKEKENTILELKDNKNNKISYELGLVKEDLKTYGYLSDTVINQYLKAIEISNKEDNIPIGLLHAITRIESDYRFWVEHKLVKTKVNGKLKEIRAAGSGGIIWELWKDSLVYYNRANEKSDLFLPYQSIRSTSLILRILIKDELKKSNDNLVGRVLIRYYGAYDKDYYNKTTVVTSDLWMKRMNLFLNEKFKLFEDSDEKRDNKNTK